MTRSPRAKWPWTAIAPAARRLPPSVSALAAPASTSIAPRAVKPPASQALRAGALFSATKMVWRAGIDSGFSIRPDAMARCAPALTAMRAAAILDTMPPEPMPEAEPPSAMPVTASIRSTRSIWRACGLVWGLES